MIQISKGVTVDQVVTLSVQDVDIIDLRSQDLFNNEHIEEAKNIPFDRIGTNKELLALDKNKAILLYCENGSISGQVINSLKEAGFRETYVLIGGFNAWKAQEEYIMSN